MSDGETFRAICKTIDDLLNKGFDNFIIYPFGDIGFQVKQILNIRYSLQEFAIVDNILASHNSDVLTSSELAAMDIPAKTVVILSTLDFGLARSLDATIPKYLPRHVILSGSSDFVHPAFSYKGHFVGKHTYGYSNFLSRMNDGVTIGNFCSINETAIIVENHPLDTVSTHTIFYNSQQMEALNELCGGADKVRSPSPRGGISVVLL